MKFLRFSFRFQEDKVINIFNYELVWYTFSNLFFS